MENQKISVTVKPIGHSGKIVDGDDMDIHSRYVIVQITGGSLPIATKTDGKQSGMKNYEVDDVIDADEVYAFRSMGVNIIHV